MSEVNSIKKSLSFIANKLTELSNLYDSDELHSVGEVIDFRGDLEGSIDRRKWLITDCESKIHMLKSVQSQVMKEMDKYKKIKTSILDNTKHVIKNNPDIKFTDSIGRRVYSTKNASPKLILKKINISPLTVQHPLSLNNYEYLMQNGYEQYTDEIIMKVLDVRRVKEDLVKGKEFSFAELEYGEHIRGLTDKLEELN